MKFAANRLFADPEAAARQLAASIEPVQDGCIHIEKINATFMFTLGGSGSQFGAGLRYAIEKGWLDLHESGPMCGCWCLARACSVVSRSGRKTARLSGTRREQFPDTAMRCASNILRDASNAVIIAYSRVRA